MKIVINKSTNTYLGTYGETKKENSTLSYRGYFEVNTFLNNKEQVKSITVKNSIVLDLDNTIQRYFKVTTDTKVYALNSNFESERALLLSIIKNATHEKPVFISQIMQREYYKIKG